MIHCPSCRHPIRIVDVIPGRFTPICPSCRVPFVLTIPEAGGGPVVEASPHTVAEPSAPSLEAIPTTLDAPSSLPGYSRLPRGVPRFFGRCLVLRLLGHGPRGRSLLARPLSLAGRVVLKVISADRGRDAIFVERFLREAMASAQLSSPHLIPIVDLGRDGSSTYTAMEFIPGTSLAEELARRGKIEPFTAAAWILQAARGLAAAHAQGIWHRDVKPENLRLTTDGLVVVDDLGLETTPSLAAAESAREVAGRAVRGRARSVAEDAPAKPAAMVRAAAGTPSYMAPEQARDALLIDGRADVYALGCTFYQLVTGRVPFERATAAAAIAGHQDEPLVPPQEFVKGLPAAISDAILGMTRKSPEERYPSMDVVVSVLESALGLGRGNTAKDEQAYQAAVMEAATRLRDDPVARLRRNVLLAAAGVWMAFLLLLLLLGAYRPLLVAAGFGVLATAALVFSSRSLRPTGLVGLLRELFLGDGLRSWIVTGLASLALLGLTLFGGYLVTAVFLGVCITALIGGFIYYIERPFLALRETSVGGVRDPLRRLRRAGMDERRLRDDLIVAAGCGWGPLFGELFGERALTAERLRGLNDPESPGAAGTGRWKSRVELLLAGLIAMRRDARLRRLFQQVEEARFEAEGMNLMTARRRSWRVSEALIRAAAEWRDEQAALTAGRWAPGAGGPQIIQHLRNAVEDPESILQAHERGPGFLANGFDAWSRRLLGRPIRFLAGAALIGAFAYWMHSHEVVTADQVTRAATEIGRAAKAAAERSDPDALRNVRLDIDVEPSGWLRPIDDPWVPSPFRSIFAANVGAAGLLLVVASIFRSRVVGLFGFLAAGLVLFAPSLGLSIGWLVPRIGAATQAMALGVAVLVAGVLLSRR